MTSVSPGVHTPPAGYLPDAAQGAEVLAESAGLCPPTSCGGSGYKAG